MIDRSHLEEPLFEFVVLADTHFVLPEKANSGEFATRRFQTARVGVALELASHLDGRFVLHLGDLVQEFPGTGDFPEALRQAMAQIGASGLDVRHAAGNHDVGDKPDPTTAAPWTTEEFLDYYHEHVGRSWFSFDEGGVHFVVLNTSVMNNAGLAAEAEQWEWLDEDLAANEGRPVVAGFHIPVFVMGRNEPSLGHYDNVAEPARSRLLDLFRRYQVDVVFAGHSHFAFVNELDGTRHYVVPSTSTTRPGFCELFSSEAPAEHGHNDADKLGIQVVRVYPDGFRVGFLRTHGPAAAVVPDEGELLLTGLPADLTGSQLGVSLRHPLANYAEVPITFPSTVRQPVRNDYPLLSLVELGAAAVRVPGIDLGDERLRERHDLLRSHSVATVGIYLWAPGEEFAVEAAAHTDHLDGIEVQVPGDDLPSEQVLASLTAIGDKSGLPLSICQVTLASIEGVQMHRRQRFGYKPEMVSVLDRHLAGSPADQVVCHIAGRDELWHLVGLLATDTLDHITRVAVLVEVGLQGIAADAWLAAEALVALAAYPSSRVYVDTLMQLDRTMDVRGGLLDRLCNPRASFRVLQTLNTVLHGRALSGQLTRTTRTSYGVHAEATSGTVMLVLHGLEPTAQADLEAQLAAHRGRPVIRYQLATGWVKHTSTDDVTYHPSDPTEPYVIQILERPLTDK